MPRREERMRVLVEAIASYRGEHGYPPAIRELMDLAGFSSTSVVTYWLDACESAGLVLREPVRARGHADGGGTRARGFRGSRRAGAGVGATPERVG